MRFEMDALGFKIIPDTIEDGIQIGRLKAMVKECATLQNDLKDPNNIVVNTKQLAKVDEALPWQRTGLGRVGFINDLLSRGEN